MKTIANLIRRAICYVNIRLLETELDDKRQCMPLVLDPVARHGLEVATAIVELKLTMARAEYTRTFPPGTRFVWRLA